MSSYPFLVQTAWYVLDKFLEDWQVRPYYWEKEIDTQNELTSRLNQIFTLTGNNIIVANHHYAVEGFKKNQQWSRVNCEPCIEYLDENKEPSNCYPDIVIWEDIKEPNRPPSLNDENWPILWACEIKYNNNSNKDSDLDIKKLKYLINQDIIQYGCWLDIDRKRASKGSGISWKNPLSNNKLWKCRAQLPPSEE